MRHSGILSSTMTFVLILVVTSPAFAYTFTNLDIPGSVATYPSGINSRGEIVGYYWDGDYVHGFVLNKDVFTTIDVPGAIATSPSGINSRGQIAGYYWDGDYVHGFVLNKDVFTTIDVPGAIVTYATGIDDLGQIVGYYWGTSGNQHGFLAAP
jgi:probable HAF family extracellular repeat protein